MSGSNGKTIHMHASASLDPQKAFPMMSINNILVCTKVCSQFHIIGSAPAHHAREPLLRQCRLPKRAFLSSLLVLTACCHLADL